MSADLLAAMDGLEARFTDWASKRQDIRAAIVVGSRARSDHPADEWADLDVAIMSTAAGDYHRDTGWIAGIAPVWTHYKDPSGTTYHVLFEGGLDAGIAIIAAAPIALATRVAPAVRRLPFSFGIKGRLDREVDSAAEYYRRGVRVLLDKDGMAERFLTRFPAREVTLPMPTPADFRATTSEFWFAAVWTAKHLWRGEIWRARSSGIEGRMRQILLTMIEWHARATHGPTYDTWREGQLLEEWADPAVLSRLRGVFAGYEAAALDAALSSMIETFAWLSRETARLLGIDDSPDTPSVVTAWIEEHRPAK
jgi:aminoglycoside 6-adenylyltransferase